MKSKFLKIVAVVLGMTALSCDSFFDINTDPNNPTDVPLSQLLPSVQVDLAGALGINSGGLSQITSTYVHQTVQRGVTINDYGVVGDDFGISTPWNVVYARGFQDIEEIIRKGTETEAAHYVGIAQIMKAYTYSLLVDVFADVPFSEANNAIEFPNPKYDQGEAVYPQLIALLDQGMANLAASSSLSPGADDLFYAGNLNRWRKFAKTVKLKMYNQVRLVQNVSAEVNALLADNDMISAQAEDFQFNYNSGVSPDNRNPAYVQEWAPNTAQYYMSPYFYELMSNMNTFAHYDYAEKIDVVDPRIPYYFYNQIAEVTPATDPENPCLYCYGYIDNTGTFVIKVPELQGTGVVAIHEFSDAIDPNAGFDQSRSQTLLGLYPLGGRYDNGAGGASNFNGNPTVPQRLLTFYAVKFIEAELYLEGVATGGAAAARTAFEAGIRAGFAKVNQIAANVGAPLIVTADINTYVNAVLAGYDASADDEERLEHIITQKWIANFGWGVDSYTDYRRTGYPVMYDANTDNITSTVRTREYPVSLPWSSANLQVNSNAPGQKIPSNAESKPFWMN